MGFISLIKRVGGALVKAQPVVNAVGQYIPPVGLFATFLNAIVGAEQVFTAPKAGKTKSEVVKQDVLASLEAAQQAADALGKTLAYDEVVLQEAIDAQVLALNKMDAFKKSFKLVDKPAGS